MAKRSELLDEADALFGDNPSYWYALLATCIHNQEVCEALIERIMKFSRRKAA